MLAVARLGWRRGLAKLLLGDGVAGASFLDVATMACPRSNGVVAADGTEARWRGGKVVPRSSGFGRGSVVDGGAAPGHDPAATTGCDEVVLAAWSRSASRTWRSAMT